jgi:type IV fimbrial biogenesis protein FimT
MNRQNAFTLIELMVVLAVLAILIMVAVPQFHTIINNNHMSATINEFTSALHYTRSEAVNRGARVTMCRRNGTAKQCAAAGTGTGWEAGWLVFVDDNDNNTYDATGTDVLLKVHEPIELNSQLRGNTNVAERISYLGTGFSSQMGRLILCNKKDADSSTLDANSSARVVVINATGRPEIKKVSEDLSYLSSNNIDNCALTDTSSS